MGTGTRATKVTGAITGRPGRYRLTSPACQQIAMATGRASAHARSRPLASLGQWAWTTSRPVQHPAVGRLPIVRGGPTASASPPLPTDRPAYSWPPAGARRNGRYERYWRYLRLITHKRILGDPAQALGAELPAAVSRSVVGQARHGGNGGQDRWLAPSRGLLAGSADESATRSQSYPSVPPGSDSARDALRCPTPA